MANNLPDTDFDTIIGNLKQAVNDAQTRQTGNNDFHTTELLPALQNINAQIDEIAKKIAAYTQKMKEMEATIGANVQQLNEKETNIASLQQEKAAINQELSTIQNELQTNNAKLDNLEQESLNNDAVYTEQLKNLRKQLESEKQDLANASDAEKQALANQIAMTENDLETTKQKHDAKKTQLEQSISELTGERDNLVNELQQTKDESDGISRQLQGEQVNSANLQTTIASLNNQLQLARAAMIEATETLNSIEQARDPDEIRRLIDAINARIGDINAILDINSEQEFFDANEGPGLPDDTPIKLQYNSNDMNYEKETTWGKLKDKLLNFNSYSKKFIEKEINTGNLEKMLNEIKQEDQVEGFLNFIRFKTRQGLVDGIIGSIQSGGRKGIKTRKTRKVRKTRKGRKTRKVRKQKGGYRYNDRTKRKSLTTTTSSKRRRTRRTTSF